jgi:hypothetical protein
VQEDFIERHVDAIAGVAAISWALVTQTIAPQLAELCSPLVAAGFGLGALGRWYRKLRLRRTTAAQRSVVHEVRDA